MVVVTQIRSGNSCMYMYMHVQYMYDAHGVLLYVCMFVIRLQTTFNVVVDCYYTELELLIPNSALGRDLFEQVT